MAVYVLTPARRAALEKAQQESARRRRKIKNRSRIRKTAAVVAVAGVAAYSVHSSFHSEERVNERIIKRHVELAEFHHNRLNSLRVHAYPTSVMTNPEFNPEAARLEAISILNRRTKKRKKRI